MVAGSEWAMHVGINDAAITSDIATLTPTNTNGGRGYIALKCVGGAVTIVSQHGAGAVVTSSTLDTLAAIGTRDYTLVHRTNGTWELWSGSSLLGSVSGGVQADTARSGGVAPVAAFCTRRTDSPTQNDFKFIRNFAIAW
jgi:hypothetical protein